MKNMKKLAGLLLALVMVLSMAVVSAEGDSDATLYSITINNTAEGHTYEAYQIFKGDLSGEAENDAAENTTAVLSNVVWGGSVTSYNGNEITAGADASDVAEALTSANLDDSSASLCWELP